MSFSRLLLLGAAAASILGCGSSSDTTFVSPDAAGLVRFVNAVPDTGFMDFRFTDAVEGVPSTPFVNLPFRGGFDRAYQRVNVGTHHVRVFMGSANTIRIKNPATPTLPLDSIDISNVPSIVSTVMGDTTFTFAEGVHYTFVFYGSARAGTQKFLILTDNIAAAPAQNFSLRAANITSTAQDVYVNSSTTTLASVSGTPGFTVAPLTATGYTNVPVAVAGANYAITAADAGTATPARSILMPVGNAAVAEVPGSTPALAAIAGSRIGGVFTAYIFPASTAGSKAASFANPGVVLQTDKQP
jgi:hypothetical protein